MSTSLAVLSGGNGQQHDGRSRSSRNENGNGDRSSSSSSALRPLLGMLGLVAYAAAAAPADAPVASADKSLDDFDAIILPDRGVAPSPSDLATPVKTVVTDTIDSLVLAADKDVLLDIYSPTCSQCGAFAVVWDAVAVALVTVPTITIAKMDGVANYKRGFLSEAEQYTFPNIKCYPAGEAKREAFAAAAAHVAARAAAQEAARAAGTPVTAADEAEKAKSQPAVGTAWAMRWRPVELISEALIDWIHDSVTHKFDKDAVKAVLREQTPAVREKLLALHSASLPAGEMVARAAPCASEWARASQIMYLSQVGMHSDIAETAEAFQGFKACLRRTERDSSKFWKSVFEHSEFIMSVITAEKEKTAAEAAAAANAAAAAGKTMDKK